MLWSSSFCTACNVAYVGLRADRNLSGSLARRPEGSRDGEGEATSATRAPGHGDWKTGRELVFNFESDPASGWLVPDQCKLYMRFKVKTKGGDTVPNTDSLRFAAAPLWGLFDVARWSMNGTTVQAVSGDLDSHAQLQLRMMGSRESHDTNGILGCDSLRQKMIHPELTSSASNTAAKGVGLGDHRIEACSGGDRWSPLDRLNPLAQVAALGFIVRWLLHVDDSALLFTCFGRRAVAHGERSGPERRLLRGRGTAPRRRRGTAAAAARGLRRWLRSCRDHRRDPVEASTEHRVLLCNDRE